IVITLNGHGLRSGQQITIAGVTGNTAANGVFNVTVIDPNNFSLNGSTGNGNYTGGGTWWEGTDPDGLPSRRRTTHQLAMNVNARGNRPQDLFSVKIPGCPPPAPNLGPPAAPLHDPG